MVPNIEVFRLQGTPAGLEKPDVENMLSVELDLVHQGSRAQLHSLSPNPLRLDEKVGTVSFITVPEGLRGGKEQLEKEKTIQLRHNNDTKPRRITLDNHFTGFTPLHSGLDAECIFDVIAVSGLHGHAFGSFKQRDEPYMWLRDSLPYDFPEARIFIYGYETRNAHFQTLEDIAKAFRYDMRRLRDDTQPLRPLIIIAHSLGGLIVKSALINSQRSRDAFDRRNFASICGLFFFGVPSQGMQIESIVPMVGEAARRSLIYSLDAVNPMLGDLEEFPDCMSTLEDGRVESVYFYETALSPTAVEVAPGQYKMQGRPAVLVTKASATMSRMRDRPGHLAVPVNRPHSELVKFKGPNDSVYETVRGRMILIRRSISSRVQVEKLSVPSERLGSVIGRGGKRISEIRSSSGARVTISDVPHDKSRVYRMVTVMGSPASNRKAIFLIRERVNADKS